MTAPDLPTDGDNSWGSSDWASWIHDQAAKVFNKLGIGDLAATGTPDATTYFRGDNTWAVPTVAVDDATDIAKGVVELATTDEATTGTDTARAVTPAGVKAVADLKADLVHASQHAADGDDPLGADLIGLTVTGIDATNVQDAIAELVDMADDSGSYWSSTALTLNVTAGSYKADSDLNFPIAAGQAVWADWHLSFSGASQSTANLRARVDAPTGATGEYSSALEYDALGSGSSAKGNLTALGAVKTFALGTGPTGIHIRGRIVNGSTAGNVVLNLAPDTTVASGPPIRAAYCRVVVDRAG